MILYKWSTQGVSMFVNWYEACVWCVAGGAIQEPQTWTDKAEVHNGEGERRRHNCRRCGRNFVEQARPQPRILVRDRSYDDSTLDAPPTDPPELSEVYNTNWPSIRSSRYNRR